MKFNFHKLRKLIKQKLKEGVQPKQIGKLCFDLYIDPDYDLTDVASEAVYHLGVYHFFCKSILTDLSR
jgi:hypothetical protein